MAEPAKKRRVKNPETFRERASKAAATADKPAKTSRTKRVVSTAGKPFRPVGRGVKRVGKLRLFHWIGFVLWPRYFRNSWRELRGVTWPTWKQSRRLTYAVLAFAVVFGGAIALVDWGLDKLFKQILLK